MILSFKQLTEEPFLPFPIRVPDDPNSPLPPKCHKTIPDLSPSLSSSSLPLLPHPFPFFLIPSPVVMESPLSWEH